MLIRHNVTSVLWKVTGETSLEHSAVSSILSGLECDRAPEFSPARGSVKNKLEKMDFVELNNHGTKVYTHLYLWFVVKKSSNILLDFVLQWRAVEGLSGS